MTRQLPLNLRELIAKIDAAEGVQRIQVTVDPLLELAAITDRCCKSATHNKALLFEAIKGSEFRVVTNLFGSEKRLCLALGLDSLGELTGWFDAILAALPGGTAAEKLASLAESRLWQAAAPVMPATAACAADWQTRPDLAGLPLLKTHPLDGYPDHDGLFLTLPTVITRSPDGGLNCGMYRAAVVAPDKLTMGWNSNSGASRHADAWASRQQPMPVAIALGTSPALTFSATLPLPEGLDEFTFAGLLQGEPLRLRRSGNGLPVPADAELIIEGYLHPGEVAGSGAFGNHSGFYTPGTAGATVRVTAVSCKRDLICPATIVGRPPMEDCWLAAAGGRLWLSLLKIDVPEAIDLYQPLAGIFHGGTIIAVRSAGDGSRELLTRIRSLPQFRASRLLVIVDEKQDPADIDGVYWRVMNNALWERDIVINGALLSIDATIKVVAARQEVLPGQRTAALVESRWREYGFND